MPAHALFGGSLSSSVPDGWLDVSALRDVPSHQEVFRAGSGASLIFEIVEHQGGVPDADAVRFFWDDLAESNEAGTRAFEELALDAGGACGAAAAAARAGGLVVAARGEQELGEHARDRDRRVRVWLGVVRLPQSNSELIVTLNVPSAEEAAVTGDAGGAEGGRACDGAAFSVAEADAAFRRALDTLTVNDWGLFDG